MKNDSNEKKWEITLTPAATVHLHYQTGSTEVFKDGFKGLARELREVADQLESLEAPPRISTQ